MHIRACSMCTVSCIDHLFETSAMVRLCLRFDLQMFWRGFFLASMTRVLPLPACVAVSSGVFAALHYAPGNLLPVFALSALCDLLYLRTSTLAAPLLLHSAWNAYQLIGIAFLGKDTFV